MEHGFHPRGKRVITGETLARTTPQTARGFRGPVRGPGSGTSDDIPAELAAGSYVLPADSTAQLGDDTLASVGARGFHPEMVKAQLSNGEHVLSPEQVHAVGVGALDQLKDDTHTPAVGGFHPKVERRLFFADGGLVTRGFPMKRKMADSGLVDEDKKPNSFGDASAAEQSGLVAKVNTGGATGTWDPAPDTTQPSTPAATPPTSDATARGFKPWAATASAPGPNDITKTVGTDGATSYSGMNVGAGATINGATPAGGTASSTSASGFPPAARALNLQQPQTPQVQAPQVLHSGNSWEARNNLRNLEVSASSMTEQPGYRGLLTRKGIVGGLQGPTPAGQAYADAARADLVARGAQPKLDAETNQTNAELARAGMQERGATQRESMRTSIDQQRVGLESARLGDQMATSALERDKLRMGNQEDAQMAQLRGVLADPYASVQQKMEAGRSIRAMQGKEAFGVPAGYTVNASGTGLQPIPGGPADPGTKSGGPLNDTQAKALAFGSRMQTAGTTLDQLAAGGVDQPGLIKRAADAVGAGPLANFTQSPQQQQVEQAQRDFVNAVLRRESGAAISESEFQNARQQYFPQIGDSQQVVKQKAANRELATKAMLAEVPDADRRLQALAPQTQPTREPPALAELRRRAQNDPALAERLRAAGY